MKKLISLLLCMVLIFSFSVAASANDNSKLSTRLEKVLGDYEPDEQIGVYLSFKEKIVTVADMPSWPDIAQARKEHKAYREQKIAEYFEVIFETIEYEEIYVSSTVVIVSVNVQDIQKLAEYDIIQDIGYFEDVEFEPYDKDSSYLFEEQYREYVDLDSGYVYDELYYHFDTEGKLDWVLLNAHNALGATAIINMDFADMVIKSESIYARFKFKYGVYDVKEGVFVDLYDLRDEPYKYEGLYDKLLEFRIGRLIGDTDNDGEISILDATAIQRRLAKIDGLDYDDYYHVYNTDTTGLISDFDRDGDVSIMDATAIQRRLAKLDVPVATPDEI